jgi:hypothetical protein
VRVIRIDEQTEVKDTGVLDRGSIGRLCSPLNDLRDGTESTRSLVNAANTTQGTGTSDLGSRKRDYGQSMSKE